MKAFFGWVRKMFFVCYNNRILRYIFYGGLSTLVNLGVFWILRKAGVPLVPANTLSVICAILFAYYVNSRFVFESKARGFKERWPEFVKFITARLSTMVIEVGGVPLLVNAAHFHELAAKIVIQFIVLSLNYVFSKFLIFVKKS